MERARKFDKKMGAYIKHARLDQKLTYEALAEKAGISSTYLKQVENQGQIPSIPVLARILDALNISADPIFFPDAPVDNLDYQRLLVYLSKCSEDDITTILALTEAFLRTKETPRDQG